MTDYLVQFSTEDNMQDHIVITIEDNLTVSELDEICEQYIKQELEIKEFIIQDIQPLNRDVDIENLLEVNNG